MNIFIVLFPVLIALSLVYYPPFWVNLLMYVDFYTSWKILHSPMYEKYHTFLTSRLPVKDEIPLPELTADKATMERVLEFSKHFTFPVVIRGLLGNSTGVQQWGNHDFWIDNYGDEELLCGLPGEPAVDPAQCNVKGFFQAWKEGRPFYISGASAIFERHKELHEMIDNDRIRAIEPGKRSATQVFIGFPGMGSDIHSAMGINMFRQIAGQKQWWFVPPSETCYLWPAINVNGFSAHTRTRIGKNADFPVSPWWNKLIRYTTILNPGDVLINPPWFWHGVKNLGEPDKLIIGSPVRFISHDRRPSFKTNLGLTIHAVTRLFLKYGTAALKPGFKPNLQADIGGNRVKRIEQIANKVADKADAVKEDEAVHPFAEGD